MSPSSTTLLFSEEEPKLVLFEAKRKENKITYIYIYIEAKSNEIKLAAIMLLFNADESSLSRFFLAPMAFTIFLLL